jgi:putative peptidoglycan lipid II flippase
MGSTGQRISQVAGWTFASRILGLIRDILLFAVLGTGMVNSAFILAFSLPNLFRRLLGEGALTSSTLPVLAQVRDQEGPAAMDSLLNAVLTRLGLLLLGLQLLAMPVFLWIASWDGLAPRWGLGAELSLILFPYMLFICLGALICGALNVCRRFGVAAFNQVWLNLALIVALLAGAFLVQESAIGRVVLLCLAVLAGGVFQLLVPAWDLRRTGWRFRFILEGSEELDRVVRLFLPGLLGAAIFQINILVSRLLAFSLDDTATGLLYLSSRLVELPLGVFAIAVTTVVFPELSRLSARNDPHGFERTYQHGLSLIWTFMLPAATGLTLMAGPILGFLFQWGLFAEQDVAAATPVLVCAAMGMPFYAWSALLTRSFYARQSMRIPVILAAVNLVLNAVLGVILMRLYGAMGLAIGNSVSATVHCFLLQAASPARFGGIRWLRLLPATVLMGLLAWQLSAWLEKSLGPGKLTDASLVFTVIPLSAGVFFVLLHLLGVDLLALWKGEEAAGEPKRDRDRA